MLQWYCYRHQLGRTIASTMPMLVVLVLLLVLLLLLPVLELLLRDRAPEYLSQQLDHLLLPLARHQKWSQQETYHWHQLPMSSVLRRQVSESWRQQQGLQLPQRVYSSTAR